MSRIDPSLAAAPSPLWGGLRWSEVLYLTTLLLMAAAATSGIHGSDLYGIGGPVWMGLMGWSAVIFMFVLQPGGFIDSAFRAVLAPLSAALVTAAAVLSGDDLAEWSATLLGVEVLGSMVGLAIVGFPRIFVRRPTVFQFIAVCLVFGSPFVVVAAIVWKGVADLSWAHASHRDSPVWHSLHGLALVASAVKWGQRFDLRQLGRPVAHTDRTAGVLFVAAFLGVPLVAALFAEDMERNVPEGPPDPWAQYLDARTAHQSAETPEQMKAAVDGFDTACLAGSPDACRDLGFCHLHGEGRRRSRARAVMMWQKAAVGYIESCEAGDGCACVNLALMYQGGYGVKRDASHAEAFAARGVRLKPEADCVVYQRNERFRL